jgi:DNA-binding MarR family transcriptional regulator
LTADATDRTTLARDLEPLTERGLVKVAAGADRRTREVRLTRQGRDAIGRAAVAFDRTWTAIGVVALAAAVTSLALRRAASTPPAAAPRP